MHVMSPRIPTKPLGKATAIEQKLVESLLRAPVTKRKISCTLDTEFPYAVKDLDKDHDNLVLSPADAIATLLHAWDRQLLEAFLDIDVNPTILIQQFEEGIDGVSRPLLLLEREGAEIKVSWAKESRGLYCAKQRHLLTSFSRSSTTILAPRRNTVLR